MNTKVYISDIHLGSYFCQTKLFVSFLQEYKRHEKCQLNLVGDTFDVWKSSPSDDMIDLLKEYSIKLFIGNHDSEILIGTIVSDMIVKSDVLTISDKKILITHGHDFDNKFGSNTYLNRVMDAIVYLVSYYLKYDIRSKIQFVTNHYYKRISNYMEIVSHKLQSAKFDVLIYGHTHMPEYTNRSDIRFINLGDWYTNPYALFIKDDQHAYIKISESKLWPNESDYKNLF